MQSPVKKIYITQVFGVNRSAYARFGLKGHNGIDYRAFLPSGQRCYQGGKSEVFAPHDGVIKECRFDSGYGNYVKIESHTQGSVLAHFSSIPLLDIGQEVKMGEFIGFQGTTGNSTGIHLHWGWYPVPRDRGNGYNGYVNQEGKYTEFGGDMTETTLDACMVDRKKFWEERDAARAELEAEKTAHKKTLEKKNELAKDLLDCESKPSAVKIDPEVDVAGSKWVVNGVTVDSNGLVTANYRKK
jgi:murein DD-endopeptidase MepM/ murein hydrolase activator NlpD